ncbi:flagellar basal-body rod protein FlgG [Geovibrio thiophilus]|uniref:Flagellar basal-body rod protein FlgG n=1 Tax=Geovibrio thiophilus TaxID=139438 RepID=A0A410JVQ8_9BACT|nr:flagellar basal-body rod protein FlgG [Geovibrio thiophilus]QAR32253.1 flagellar basal-body rod protein FlgG [Geovibrio thiophilus]
MMRTLWTAATGMTAQQTNVDTIANNLSNVNNVGFKKSRVLFDDLMYQEVRRAGAITAAGLEHPTGIEIGLGTKVTAIQKIHSQGSFQYTGNNMDVAIEGDGYFQIALPDGNIAYTRAGAFQIDGNGNLTTPNGYLLEPAIVVPEDSTEISFAEDGTVSVVLPGDEEPTEIGAIELARFINPSGLHAMGKNLYLVTGSSGDPQVGVPGEDGFGVLAQNILEMSNVSLVEEMVAMITGQRAYEINSKAVQTGDDMLQIVNNLKR